VAVLKDGLLQQVDTPRNMYDRPANVFVAGFIGSPAMNLLEVDVVDGGVAFGSTVVPVDRTLLGAASGSKVTMGVRPEDLEVSDAGLKVEVDVVEELGADAYIYGRARFGTDEKPIIARVDGRRPPEKGATISLAPKVGHIHLFDAQDGHRLG
jgi:multiple sugar transport system ATP-binding protein